jgi:hypothetical protein
MIRFSSRHAAAFLLPLAGATAPALAQADSTVPAGVLWEVTSQTSMEAMPFPLPAQKLKVCAAADASEPPGSANDERGCVNSDMQRDGDTVTWTSVCAGPPEMSGQGTLTYAGEGDAYTGSIRYATEEGTIVINLAGQRIGTCDKPR